MAVRIQVRRGTTSEWNTANPTLFEGEFGYNTTLDKFKVGDGTTAWSSLEYVPTSDDLSTSLGDYIELIEKGAADGVAELDASKNVITALSVVFEGATENEFETRLTVTEPASDITLSLPNATGTLALTTDITVTESSINTLTNKTLTSPIISGLTISDGSILVEGATANEFETTLQFTDPTADRTITFPDETGTVQLRVADVSDTEIGYLNGVTSAIQTQLDDKLPKAGGTMTGAIAMGTNKITGLGDPTADQDAATKAYVDAATAGLNVHDSVKAATTANVNLSNAVEAGDTLDGVTLAHNDRILVKNQNTAADNGVYVVANSGAPTRASDYNQAGEVDAGDFIFVEGGTVNGKTGWVQTNTITTLGTDALAFTQFSGAGTYLAGTGLTLTGSTFSANIGTDIQAYNSTLAAVAGGTYTGDDSITTLGTITSGTWTGTAIAIANGGTGQTSASAAANALLPDQASNSGKYLTTNGSGTLSWGTVSGYSAPTIGSTSIASGATVTTIDGLTLTTATLTTPTLTLSSTTSSTDGRIAWISAQDKITVGDGTNTVEFAPATRLINQQTASYTLVLTDKDKIVEMSVGSANNLTVPLNSSVAYPIGTVIDIVQVGSGQTTVVATGGVTINSTSGLKIRTQWGSASLIKRAENTWVLIGDVAA